MTQTDNFDIAVGISQTGLNQAAAALFAVPAAKQKLFSGRVSENISPLGEVTLTYELTQAPTFVLQPPTAAQWEKAQKVTPDEPRPTSNAFQLSFSAVSGSVTIGSSPTLLENGALSVFGELVVSGGQASLLAKAVYIDESSFSTWDKFIVNQVLVPEVLKLATSLLSGIGIPPIPKLVGLTFQPPVAVIRAGYVLAASTLTGGGTTTIDAMTPPAFDLFAACKLNPINQALANQINGKSFAKEGKSGPSGWYAAGKVSAKDVNLTASINGRSLVASVAGQFSGYGELGGVGVGVTKAALCPIGAAVDAIANPGDWDKVVASFDILYKPDPLRVPLTVSAGAPSADGQDALLSVGDLGSVQLIYKPTWSGSVSGTVLSAAAAAFIDLVSVTFGKSIIDEVVKKQGQNRAVYTIPPLAQTLEGVTATLTIDTSQPVTVDAPDLLVQGLHLAFS